jgi:hypothetical protein
VKVTEAEPPSVTAPAPVSVNVNSSCDNVEVPNFISGLVASDNCTPRANLEITQSPAVETLVGVGAHPITITVKDVSGNTTVVTSSFNVVDNTPPIITLTGPSSVTVECHTSFNDPGATATDNCAGSFAATASGNVDVNVPATYTVTYNASDPSGNAGTPATRTVTVVDTTPPTLSLNVASTMTVECHASFTDPGATASDSCDSNVPVTVSGSVDANTPGTYTLTYNAHDAAGNAAAAGSRTVRVVDTTPPVITINGANPMTIECHTSFTDPGATAADACDSSAAVTATNNVNPNVPGTYQVTYTSHDAAGNNSTAIRTVVVSDTIAPTITLSNLTIFLNDWTIVFNSNTVIVNGVSYPFNGVSFTKDNRTFAFNGSTITITINGHSSSYTLNGKTLVLWTPTHQYQTVKVADLLASVSDGCDATTNLNSVVISQVTSDEPEDIAGGGDGNTLHDIVIAADCKSVQVRAERDGNSNGRVYTITLRVRDASGNTSTVTSKLNIFANSFNVVDSGPHYTVNGICP